MSNCPKKKKGQIWAASQSKVITTKLEETMASYLCNTRIGIVAKFNLAPANKEYKVCVVCVCVSEGHKERERKWSASLLLCH